MDELPAQMELTTLSRPRQGARETTPFLAETRDPLREEFPIIVHSHLAWDWVWQRPQQFHSRLSQRHNILFVEGPVPAENVTAASLILREIPHYPNIVVLQMQVPRARWTNGAWVDKERRRLVQSVLAGPLGLNFVDPVQWFYDPMAVTAFAGHLDEQAIVYDCMDQLSQFRGAPPELVRRERELLAVADVVFAGGPKIATAKRSYNSNCYSFGCGVDIRHFGKARRASTALPKDVAHLTGPILGYFGVVDERIDYDLLATLADYDPEWNVVIVGPWTKVERDQFPARPNLHWLGGRAYALLPAYVRAFDVCLMPFAINAATEFINPTKALEYMATGRPIVSTAVADVVLQFGDVIHLAASPEEFVEHCGRALRRTDTPRIRRGLRLARQNSWESIVEQLEKHVDDVLRTKRALAMTAA